VTLDQYAMWAASTDVSRSTGMSTEPLLLEIGLAFVREIGKVAGALTRRPSADERWRDGLAEALGDLAYHWARLCAITGVAPSTLLARSRAHIEWRQAGRPPGGPAPASAGITLEEYAAWVAAASRPGDRPDYEALLDIGLALAGDAGEVVECLRRVRRESDGPRERLVGELGDVWRYWTRLCAATGLTPAELLARSRARIEAGLPGGSVPPPRA
jgi:phosphoribosyl-ATP pyrophosphohydrolase